MRDFKVAGTAAGPNDEELLEQVVHIAGFADIIHRLVSRHFTFCHEHSTVLPRPRPGPRRVSRIACGPACFPGAPRFRGY